MNAPAVTFTANLVHFVRYLRTRGVGVVPATAADLAAAVDIVGLADRDDLYAALRSMCIARPTEQDAFDDAFELFFGTGRLADVRDLADRGPQTPGKEQPSRAVVPVLRSISVGVPDDESEVIDTAGGSYHERLAGRDFGDLTRDEQEEVRRLIARMIWRPADAPSRRWRPDRSGGRPDLRRTLRATVRPEGDLVPLAMAGRRPRRRPLVVLADISGSMERYTEMFLYFIHAAQGRLGRVEAFVFATRLTRITREMRLKLPDEAIHRASRTVHDWSGGTRIGEALAEFNAGWSRRVTRGGAIGLIISDGWDTGDSDVLEREMARFARSMHRVIWLNPLAARSGFRPETRGMRTALPHVDDFLAAASLLDLRAVVGLLETVPAR